MSWWAAPATPALPALASDPAVTWGVVTCIALPHLLYAFIWFFPDLWRAAFPKKPVEVFETFAWALKIVQFSSAIAWYMVSTPEPVFDLELVQLWQWVLAAALLAGGQALNLGIYKAIGHPGVYYGFKLGHAIPWVDGFPFNVVAHPQYVGSAMSVWGAAVVVLGQGNDAGLLALAGYWTLLYVVTAVQEQFM